MPLVNHSNNITLLNCYFWHIRGYKIIVREYSKFSEAHFCSYSANSLSFFAKYIERAKKVSEFGKQTR